MADITTTINGQPVTLIDNLDGTYRVDLNTSEARRFIRTGELAQLRAERDELVLQRTKLNGARDQAISERDHYIAERQVVQDRIDVIAPIIDELVAFLQAVGDDPGV